MEIGNYVEYIKEQLNEFTGKDDLEWSQVDLGTLQLENKKIRLAFMTQYRSEDSMGITIRNKSNNEYYTLFTIIKRKGFDGNSFMTQNELNVLESITDPISRIIYIISIFIKKHCQDVMSGDFSSVGPGSPTFT